MSNVELKAVLLLKTGHFLFVSYNFLKHLCGYDLFFKIKVAIPEILCDISKIVLCAFLTKKLPNLIIQTRKVASKRNEDFQNSNDSKVKGSR